MDTMQKVANEELISGFLAPQGSDMQKSAAETGSDYLKMRLYEKGFFRKILPLKPFGKTDKQVDTDAPVKIVEKEPSAAAAYSVPFGKMPMGAYLAAPKFRVMLDRIMSRRYRIDVDILDTYEMDLKSVLEEILLKKIQHEEDSKFIATVNYICSQGNTVKSGEMGLPANSDANSFNTELGSCQNVHVGPMDRDSVAELTKGLPSTNRNLEPAMALVNNLTVRDVTKFSRDEIGGDIAQDMFKNGFTEQKIHGIDWCVTTKRDLVPNNTVYQFASPEFLGRGYAKRDLQLDTKRENMWVEFWAWETIGAAIGNSAAVACAHFDGSPVDWETGS
jgi:hypothetical protein